MLKKIGREIDELNDKAEAGARNKADRIKLREAALAELRKFRNVLEKHPAVQLYRGNPFDSGTAVQLVNTAMHQVEIAILACVSPHEAD